CLGELDTARRDQRGELAETMASHHTWHGTTAFAPQSVGRNTRGKHRRLRAFGGIQGPFRSLLAQFPQIVAQYLGGLRERGLYDRRFLGEQAHHANRLRTLAGKDKR